MDLSEGSKITGRFNVSSEKTIDGELTFAGPKTSLYVHDKDTFELNRIANQCIWGQLHDLTKVTLVEPITAPLPGYAQTLDERYYFADIFPHYVVYGHQHLNPLESSISEISFLIDDATTLFYDFDAFGFVIDARSLIDTVAHANRLSREVLTGQNPLIAYFTGKTEICAADTVLGRVSAYHNLSYSLPSPAGVRIDNNIMVAIAFQEPVTFGRATLDALTIIRYLSILIGRPQNLLKVRVKADVDKQARGLDVYWCMPPMRDPSKEGSNPHPADVLVNGGMVPKDFSRILIKWLERERDWGAARARFFNCFAEQVNYGIDRLIAAANIFDILPDSAVPDDIRVSDDLKNAADTARDAFQSLSRSAERDSVLSALGRIGKPSLKRKVRHRAKRIVDVLGDRFPQLLMVIDEAINCRNYYVHGGEARFDYEAHVVFFTETLEFIFAISDLIDAGWNMASWIANPTSGSHPFGRFRLEYGMRLQELEKALNSAAAEKRSAP